MSRQNARVSTVKLPPRLAEALQHDADGRLRRPFVYLELWLRPSRSEVRVSINGSFTVGEFVHPIRRDVIDRLYALFKAEPPERAEIRCLIGLRYAALELDLENLRETDLRDRGFISNLTEAYLVDQEIEVSLSQTGSHEPPRAKFGVKETASETPSTSVTAEVSAPLGSSRSRTGGRKHTFRDQRVSFHAATGGTPTRPYWTFHSTIPYEDDSADPTQPTDLDQFPVLEGNFIDEHLVRLKVTGPKPRLKGSLRFSAVRDGLFTRLADLQKTAPGVRPGRLRLLEEKVLDKLERELEDGLMFFEWTAEDDQKAT